MSLGNIFHYTDQAGWNAIRSQTIWTFNASQPKDSDRPYGAYFTDIEPSAENLRTLYKRIRVPKLKQEYVFWFVGASNLKQLNNGFGRDKRIFFSPTDYNVVEDRQKHGGVTDAIKETFA